MLKKGDSTKNIDFLAELLFLKADDYPEIFSFQPLQAEGREIKKEGPERVREVNKEIEIIGAKIVFQYLFIRPCDFINVVDAPSNWTIVRVLVQERTTIVVITHHNTCSPSEFKGARKTFINGASGLSFKVL